MAKKLARRLGAGRCGCAVGRELERDVFTAGVDGRKLLRAIGGIGCANGVIGIGGWFLFDLGGESGDGVFALHESNLDVRTFAGPFRGVFAGFESLSVDLYLTVDVNAGFVGFGTDGDACEEKCESCEYSCQF